MAQCSICLSNFTNPVCIPCGHVYCQGCLMDHSNRGNNKLNAKCPDCRASFHLVVPDIACLPEKYHQFVTHNVRRIYVDFSFPNKELRESLKAAEDRLARKAATEQGLLRRCEELLEALNAHRQGERDANRRILELEEDIANLESLSQEKDDTVKDLQRMHGLVVDKVRCVEKSNEVLQKENVRLSLSYHDIEMKLKEKKSDSSISIRADTLNEPPYRYFSKSASAASRPKQRQQKDVYATPEYHTPTNSSSVSTPIARAVPSRPIKPLPKRRAIKYRLVADSSFVPIDVSDFI